MPNDPYRTGMLKKNPYHAKTDVEGRLAAVLDGRYESRGLLLIYPASRCVKKHELHELIASDEDGVAPGGAVDRIGYLGFVEITEGGVIVAGDEVLCGEECIGRVAGFDETHMPNHLNIVIKCGGRASGAERGWPLGGKITFRQLRPQPFGRLS